MLTAEAYGTSKARAITAWNTRTPPESSEPTASEGPRPWTEIMGQDPAAELARKLDASASETVELLEAGANSIAIDGTPSQVGPSAEDLHKAATLIEQQAATIAELEARDREIAHKLQDARTTLTKRAYGRPAITGDNLVLPPDAFDSIVRSLDAARAALQPSDTAQEEQVK